VDSTGHDLNDPHRSGLDPDVPPSAVTSLTTADVESTTTNSTCYLCAARLATSGQREPGGDDDSQRVGAQWDEEIGNRAGVGTCDCNDVRLLTQHFLFLIAFLCAALQIVSLFIYIETPSVLRRRHRFDTERGGGSRSRSSKTDRRLRRLEKMVESLSHGLILALTQLKSSDVHAESRRRSASPGRRQSHKVESVSRDDVDDDNDRNLSTAFAGMGFLENLENLVESGKETFIFVLVTLGY